MHAVSNPLNISNTIWHLYLVSCHWVLLYSSSAIQERIVKCMVDVSFVATLKMWTFNRRDFLKKFSLIIWYIDFVMITYILNCHVCYIEFTICQWNEGLLSYTHTSAMCPNCILEFGNTNSHSLQVYLGAGVKI